MSAMLYADPAEGNTATVDLVFCARYVQYGGLMPKALLLGLLASSSKYNGLRIGV